MNEMKKIGIVGPEFSKWKSKEQIEKAKDAILKSLCQRETPEKTKAITEWCKAHFDGNLIERLEANGRLAEVCELYLKTIILVSGHCPKDGVDIRAEEIADELGIKKEIYPAEVNQWEDRTIYGNLYPTEMQRQKGYKSRNIQIAEACDVLYCIVPNVMIGFNAIPFNKECYCRHCKVWKHPTNGGCWTMKYAKKLGKETHLVVIE